MNYYSPTISIGDLLIRPKALGLFDHIGVVVAPNTVLQNTPGKGEHLSTVNEFSNSQPIKVRHTGADPFIVTARAQKTLANPKQYDAATRNCEHTAYEIVCGIAKSPQFIAAVIVGLCVVMLFVALRRG